MTNTPSSAKGTVAERAAAARSFLAARLDPRRRWSRANWQLWAGLAALTASIVFFNWQPLETYTTVNYCSSCYLGWTTGIGLTGGWGIGALGALIGLVMVAATFVFATWRPDRPAPTRISLVPAGVMLAGVVVLLLNVGELFAAVGGLLRLDLALGAPAWIVGLVLLFRWFKSNGGDFSPLQRAWAQIRSRR